MAVISTVLNFNRTGRIFFYQIHLVSKINCGIYTRQTLVFQHGKGPQKYYRLSMLPLILGTTNLGKKKGHVLNATFFSETLYGVRKNPFF